MNMALRKGLGCSLAALGAACTGAPHVERTCALGVDCPPGQSCENGACTGISCAGTPCPEGMNCVKGLCRLRDCDETTACSPTQVCEKGACLDARCVDVECPSGQVCAAGLCKARDCPAATCASRAVCAGDRCVPASCIDVHCPAGSACADGRCAPAACGASLCKPGEACVGGACVDAACVGMSCASPLACRGGACLPPGCGQSPCPSGGACVDNVCVAAGCAAKYPAPETCNGLDDDCNGIVDDERTVACAIGAICEQETCREGCRIDDRFHAPGVNNPASSCQNCDPKVATGAWADKPLGTPCGNGLVCSGGSCLAGCVIAGNFVAADDPNPANACQWCEPARSQTAWSPKPPGACGANVVCNGQGACVAGCAVDGNFYTPGTLNTANDCQSCQPASSNVAFTNLADGAPCRGGAGACLGGVCP